MNKIKEYQARYKKIIKLRNSGKTMREIGLVFGVSHQAISLRIIRGMPKERPRSPYAHKNMKQHGRELVRGYVRFRDNFTCQGCGDIRTPEMSKKKNRRQFDVHHLEGLCGKKSRGYDKVSDMGKLITLCHKCHFNRPEHRVKSVQFRKRCKKAHKKLSPHFS